MNICSGAGKGGMGGGGSATPNDFRNRLLYSSKFDEKEACGGEGGG